MKLVHFSNSQRKIYSREELKSFQSCELSKLWPKSLDKNFVNCSGQWDPVKSFDNSKSLENKRNNYFDNNKPFRNPDKSKDDISLRPERRRWNDGCQVSNKRNDDNHTNSSYRKSYQNAVPNCGGGDFDRSRYNRNSNRGNKPKDSTEKESSKFQSTKSDRISRNNSNIEERKDGGSDEMKINNSRNCNNFPRSSFNSEPEWFIDGPDNCDETIELHGITANDTAMLNFKVNPVDKNSAVPETGETPGESSAVDDKLIIEFPLEKSVFVEARISPKREGSRFQEIFQKEAKNSLNESREVESLLKAMLSEKVPNKDAAEKLNVSKPLPNGVLTVEELEKGLAIGVHENSDAVKSPTVDTLTSFDPSLNSLLSSSLSSPSQDNAKVVNWLSGLNISNKELDLDSKFDYPETSHFNPIINQQPNHMPNAYSKFVVPLQPPPGLPLVYNNNIQQHQQQLFQHHNQQSRVIQPAPFMKHLPMSQTNNVNHTVQQQPPQQPPQRGFMPFMLHPNPGNELEDYMKKFNGQAPPISSEYPIDQKSLSNLLMQKTIHPMNHMNDRNNVLMNGPPGLTNLNVMEKNLMMHPRPIVKTSSPQILDLNRLADINRNYQNNIAYQRTLSNNPQLIQSFDQKKAQFEMMKNRELIQQRLLMNSIQNRQPIITSAHDHIHGSSNKMLANLFNNVSSTALPPVPQQARYADQLETENI